MPEPDQKKAEKDRALLMPTNLELDEEKAHGARSKIDEMKKVLQNPMPLEFPLPLGPGAEQEEGGESGQEEGGKRTKKTYRLGMEYVDYVAENPLPHCTNPFLVSIWDSSSCKKDLSLNKWLSVKSATASSSSWRNSVTLMSKSRSPATTRFAGENWLCAITENGLRKISTCD